MWILSVAGSFLSDFSTLGDLEGYLWLLLSFSYRGELLTEVICMSTYWYVNYCVYLSMDFGGASHINLMLFIVVCRCYFKGKWLCLHGGFPVWLNCLVQCSWLWSWWIFENCGKTCIWFAFWNEKRWLVLLIKTWCWVYYVAKICFCFFICAMRFA